MSAPAEHVPQQDAAAVPQTTQDVPATATTQPAPVTEPLPPAYTRDAAPATAPVAAQPAPAPVQTQPVREQYAKGDPPTVYVTPLNRLGDFPAQVDCPYCQCQTRTRVHKEMSGTTVGMGVLLGFFCICLACLPCMMGACENTDHYCGRCGNRLTHQDYGKPVLVVARGATEGLVPSQYPAPANPPPAGPPPARPENAWIRLGEVARK